MNKYFLLIIAAILSAAPPILIKKYINNQQKDTSLIYFALIFSTLLLIVYINLCKHYGASRMYTIVKILSIVMVVIIGFIFLDEKITIQNIVGIFFGIISLVLLVSN